MFCDSEATCVNFGEKRMTFMHIYAYNLYMQQLWGDGSAD